LSAGVCAMCGKQVLDTKLYKQSNVWPKKASHVGRFARHGALLQKLSLISICLWIEATIGLFWDLLCAPPDSLKPIFHCKKITLLCSDWSILSIDSSSCWQVVLTLDQPLKQTAIFSGRKIRPSRWSLIPSCQIEELCCTLLYIITSWIDYRSINLNEDQCIALFAIAEVFL